MTRPNLFKSGPLHVLLHWLGVPEHGVSWRERLAATLTAAAGILIMALASSHALDLGTVGLMASIGASAVLVFAVPHGALSQPWAVLGGHCCSALVGVLVAQLLGGGIAAAAVAVAGAITLMHGLRCIHPPGGATALSMVLMAHHGHPPDWHYLLSPVLLNVALILLAATLLNAPFPWRRYPVAWAFHRHPVPKGTVLAPEAPFTPRQLREALEELDSLVDISDDELQALYQVLRRRQEHEGLRLEDLRVGAYYSNGEAGEHWAVRRIIDASEPNAKRPQLIVKTVAGPGRGQLRLMARRDFLAWGRYEVRAEAAAWQRVEQE